MAEQIRQQQLAAALESRLDSQSFSAMQAALLMNKLKSGSSSADTSTLLAAASALGVSNDESNVQTQNKKQKGRGRGRGRPVNKIMDSSSIEISGSQNIRSGDKLNKNTVASLLAKSRELSGGATLSAYDLERAENSFSRPELTIEPIYRSSNSENDQFDSSDGGRRFQSVMEDGKLKIKTISDSPEIRNLSDHEENNEGYDSDDLQANVSSSMGRGLSESDRGIDDGTDNIVTNNITYNDASTNSMSCSYQPNSVSQATLSIATSTTTNTNNITSMLSAFSSKLSILSVTSIVTYLYLNFF